MARPTHYSCESDDGRAVASVSYHFKRDWYIGQALVAPRPNSASPVTRMPPRSDWAGAKDWAHAQIAAYERGEGASVARID